MALSRYLSKLAALLNSSGQVPASGLQSGAAVSNIGYTPMVGDGQYNSNSSIDLNTVVNSGTYRIGSGATNLPSGATGYGNLLVLRSPGYDTIAQIYVTYDGALAYIRSGNPPNIGGVGTWNTWSRLFKHGDVFNFVHGSNTGEARFGRADDRGVGVATIQLGGSSAQRFEIVDRNWSSILFSVEDTGRTGSWGGHVIQSGSKNGFANRTLGVISGDNWTSGSSYVHILLPERYSSSYNRMFQLIIQGYCLDNTTNRNIDLMISGYVTTVGNGGPISAISSSDPSGAYSPTAYYSSTYNRGVARFYLASKYYTTFVVDALQAGNGDTILPGELQIIFSTASTL